MSSASFSDMQFSSGFDESIPALHEIELK